MKAWRSLAMVLVLIGCSDRQDAPPGTLDLERLDGQWVVINYWAEWCKPCIKEIPELNALDKRYPAVTVMGINYDGLSGEELQAQAREFGIEFHLLTTDPAPQLGVARPVVLPTTLILDPQGRLTETLVGPQTLESLALVTGQVSGESRTE
ncbi:MAG: TlpA disulfide reductase family protein [Halioglobus sp.]|jgi:thiol-disulfide isomerase/thioredoxin